MSPYWPSLFGGMLLGLACILLFLFNGRIAGISGIMGRMLGRERRLADLAFLAGLLAGPYLYAAAFGRLPTITIIAPWPLIIIAGLLVGFGTRMGSGCTSGHGIMGLARFSRRSIAATATFLMTGIVAATITGAMS
ncbi:YeeE/YedE family protein [Agrobacterium sp. O3.4]|uniref:YeeE/YedE family protein n=1 Tax=Agrobacterium cucumeris TaxID=2862866 RepID=A0ABY8RS18_9HYPH|nr:MULTISPECIES: YeeE/YedE family protein [Rhizobium/Agrobacterium group]MCZ7468999.1 YeeE/YedE family protein [Rhizobium rhizogenes]MCZ7488882.1 YeeE/YedE family protein [Rhizobium rhizogenes]MDA5633335.1 YeeE/YedE family protein [Agrobacterium sp. ST15.16.024]MDF1888978.1 YeeE/YedE family protein [Rhizobium rhizogenes]WHO10301.1 YeeE/YedE family protein [Agrobacterium cucumeris]